MHRVLNILIVLGHVFSPLNLPNIYSILLVFRGERSVPELCAHFFFWEEFSRSSGCCILFTRSRAWSESPLQLWYILRNTYMVYQGMCTIWACFGLNRWLDIFVVLQSSSYYHGCITQMGGRGEPVVSPQANRQWNAVMPKEACVISTVALLGGSKPMATGRLWTIWR